jgi:hypothetical protein
MAGSSHNQEELKRLLKSLDPESAQTAQTILHVALMKASAVAAGKKKEVSESDLRKIFTDDIQIAYDDLLKKLSPEDKKLFIGAVEQAKINGAKQPELYESGKE